MSELTQCNYCSLQEVKARAKKNKMVVTLLAGHPTFKGLPAGIDVYVHPKSVKIREVPHVPRQAYWYRWFMERSDRCCC